MERVILNKYLGQLATVQVERPLGTKHPEKDFYYAINYGFIPNTISGDGEPIDAYIIGVYNPLPIDDMFLGKIVAIINRKDDVEDKLIVAPTDCRFLESEFLRGMVHFAERRYDHNIVCMPPDPSMHSAIFIKNWKDKNGGANH